MILWRAEGGGRTQPGVQTLAWVFSVVWSPHYLLSIIRAVKTKNSPLPPPPPLLPSCWYLLIIRNNTRVLQIYLPRFFWLLLPPPTLNSISVNYKVIWTAVCLIVKWCWLLCERTLFVIPRGSEENNNCAGFEVVDGEVLAIARDGEAMLCRIITERGEIIKTAFPRPSPS